MMLSCAATICIHKNRTTDTRDFTDANHERKREIPWICAICVLFKKTTDIWDFRDINHERKREIP